MRIESLELFLSVAEHGSVSRTAKQHFISQQGVSSALKALEKELGTPLFTRGGPKLELTERGRAIASEAQRIVDSHRRMLAIASAPKDAKPPYRRDSYHAVRLGSTRRIVPRLRSDNARNATARH